MYTDPVLVGRLWRPVERPGVIDPGLARVLATRHQRMVGGLPLAELVSRHTGSDDLAGTALPIVYVLPRQSPLLPDVRPSDARPGPGAASPIMPAGPVQGSPPAPSSPAAIPVVPQGTVVHEVTSALVVQRQIDEPSSAAGSPPEGSPSEGAGSVLQRPLLPGPRPLDLRPLDLPSLDQRRPHAGPSDPGDTAAGHDQGTLRSETPPVVGWPLPAVVPAAVPAAHDATSLPIVQYKVYKVIARSALGSTQRERAQPVLQRPPPAGPRPLYPPRLDLRTPNVGLSEAGPPDLGSVQPRMPLIVATRPSTSWPSGERPAGTLAVAVHRPEFRPQEPLLLVDLGVAISRPVRDRPGIAEHRESREPVVVRTPVADRVPVAGQDASTPPSADRASADRAFPARAQATAPIDIEHIVDTVHRRFVRRLAIEAERRAVR